MNTTASLAGLVRHIMTFGGGYLVASGTLTQVDVQNVSAAVITIGGIVWSLIQKRKAAR